MNRASTDTLLAWCGLSGRKLIIKVHNILSKIQRVASELALTEYRVRDKVSHNEVMVAAFLLALIHVRRQHIPRVFHSLDHHYIIEGTSNYSLEKFHQRDTSRLIILSPHPPQAHFPSTTISVYIWLSKDSTFLLLAS